MKGKTGMGDHSSVEVDGVVKDTVKSQQRVNGGLHAVSTLLKPKTHTKIYNFFTRSGFDTKKSGMARLF